MGSTAQPSGRPERGKNSADGRDKHVKEITALFDRCIAKLTLVYIMFVMPMIIIDDEHCSLFLFIVIRPTAVV